MAKKKTAATPHERLIERLRHPTQWASYARWALAMERIYGPHHVDWPLWGLDAMQRHVAGDVGRAAPAAASVLKVAKAAPKRRAKKAPKRSAKRAPKRGKR